MCCATNKLDHTPREVDAHRHTSTHAFSGTKLYLGKEPFFWFGGPSSWWWWISDPSNSYASGLAAQLALRESLSWLTKEAGMGLVVVLVFLPLFTDRLWPQRLQTHFFISWKWFSNSISPDFSYRVNWKCWTRRKLLGIVWFCRDFSRPSPLIVETIYRRVTLEPRCQSKQQAKASMQAC